MEATTVDADDDDDVLLHKLQEEVGEIVGRSDMWLKSL